MNPSLQTFVAGRAVLNRTLSQAEEFLTICENLAMEVVGLFGMPSGTGTATGPGPSGTFPIPMLQASPYDLGATDAIYFVLAIQYDSGRGMVKKLIDVGPSLDILNDAAGVGVQPTTRLEQFLGETYANVLNPQPPGLLAYIAISRIPAVQSAVASSFGLTEPPTPAATQVKQPPPQPQTQGYDASRPESNEELAKQLAQKGKK